MVPVATFDTLLKMFEFEKDINWQRNCIEKANGRGVQGAGLEGRV